MSLILNIPSLPITKIKSYLQSSKQAKVESALRSIIINLSNNNDMGQFMSLAIRVCANNKKYKKLFFLMVEQMKKTENGKILAEVLLVCNLLRKDMESANEFVRARVMRLMESVHLDDLLEVLVHPMVVNLEHPNGYVRRNAVYGLAMVYKKYPEAKDLIYKAMIKNMERQAFASTLAIDRKRAMDIFNCDIELMDTDLLEFIIPMADLNFLKKCQKLERCPFETNLALIKKKTDYEIKEKAINAIFEEIRLRPQLRVMALKDMKKYCSRDLRGHALEIIELSQTKEQFEVCADLAVKVASSHEKKAIQDFLIEKFSIEEFREIVIKCLAAISDQEDEVAPLLNLAIVDKNPKVVYETVHFLKSKKFKTGPEILLKGLSTNSSCVFKFILNVLAEKLENPDILIDFALKYVDEKRDVFFGQDIAMALSKIRGYEKEKSYAIEKLKLHFENKLKEMEVLNSDKLDNLISSAITAEAMENIYDLCLESGTEDIINLSDPLKNNELLTPPDFSSIKFENPPKICKSEFSRLKIVSLTGIGDPIYCEARVKIDELNIDVEILFANQTNSTLHNVSANLCSPIEQKSVTSSFTLLPRTLKAHHYLFEMKELSSCFITGTISFNFVQNGQMDLQSMTLNLAEIKFKISDFLRPKKIEIGEFQKLWVDLEWENSYTHLPANIQLIADKMNCSIVQYEKYDEYLVAILSAMTLQGEMLLINISVEPNVMRCRIRGTKECVVKSVGEEIGSVVVY
ncbi:Coatomer subunit beta [Dictyocoela muelleri]|nr:Coatomer subunit beta [Dictyocoela muelleri]